MSLTDSEIDELLERFDQTEPRLQRQIIAKLAEKAAMADDLLAACEFIKVHDCGPGWCHECYKKAHDAVAKARGN